MILNNQALRDSLKNRFFKVKFLKKSGEEREMIARLGVKKHLKGGEKSYNDDDFNYLTVFDMQKQQYRTLNCNTILEIKFDGITLQD